MNICGVDYQVLDVYDQSITVPDSYVMNENKTGKGHGEAKLYMGSKDAMRNFYAGNPHAVRCKMLYTEERYSQSSKNYQTRIPIPLYSVSWHGREKEYDAFVEEAH